MKDSLEAIAEEVINILKDKVVIHRYDSYSTNSIYLKFDYGVANSLRISDHRGKRHLSYRYNIIEGLKISSKKSNFNRGHEMRFYSPEMIKACCRDILKAKAEKQKQYFDYDAIVFKQKVETKHLKGFWSDAKIVE